jgi:hypothetical protein
MAEEEQCCKRSLLGSLWDTAKKVVKDPVPVSDEVQEERMLICHQCPKFCDGRCIECGCYMRLKTKFAEVECPIGKWGKHEKN